MNQKRSIRLQSIEFGKGRVKASNIATTSGRIHKSSSNLKDASLRAVHTQKSAATRGGVTGDHLIISPLGTAAKQTHCPDLSKKLSLLSANQRAFLQQCSHAKSQPPFHVEDKEIDLTETCLDRMREEMSRVRSRMSITDTQRASLLQDALRLSPGTAHYEKIARQHAHIEKDRREEKKMFHVRLKQERRRREQVQRGRRSYCHALSRGQEDAQSRDDKSESMMEVCGENMLISTSTPILLHDNDSPFPHQSEALPCSPSVEFYGCFFTAEDSVILDGDEKGEKEEEEEDPEAHHELITHPDSPLLQSNLIRAPLKETVEADIEKSINESDLQKAYEEITRVRQRMIQKAGGLPDDYTEVIATEQTNKNTINHNSSNSHDYTGEEADILPLTISSSPEKITGRIHNVKRETVSSTPLLHHKPYLKPYPKRRDVEMISSERFPSRTSSGSTDHSHTSDDHDNKSHNNDIRNNRYPESSNKDGQRCQTKEHESSWYFNNTILDNIIRDESPEYYRKSYPHAIKLPLTHHSNKHLQRISKQERQQRYISPERQALVSNLNTALDSLAAHCTSYGNRSMNSHEEYHLSRPQSTSHLNTVSQSFMSPILEGKEKSLGRPKTTMSTEAMSTLTSCGHKNEFESKSAQLRSAKTRLLKQRAADNILVDTPCNTHMNSFSCDNGTSHANHISQEDINKHIIEKDQSHITTTVTITPEEPDESFLQALQLAAQAGDAIGKLLRDSRSTPMQ